MRETPTIQPYQPNSLVGKSGYSLFFDTAVCPVGVGLEFVILPLEGCCTILTLANSLPLPGVAGTKK